MSEDEKKTKFEKAGTVSPEHRGREGGRRVVCDREKDLILGRMRGI